MYNLKLFEEYHDRILVYHGTPYEFDEFKTKRRKSGYGYSMGAYFSDNRMEAERYGKNVQSYYLSFNNLLDLSFIAEDDINGKEKFFDYIEEKCNIVFENRRRMIYSNPNFGYTTLESLDESYDLVPKLKRKGVDGVAFNEVNGITYVVFNKSVIEIN